MNFCLFECTFNENKFQISYIKNLTMFDGKICSAISGRKPWKRCYLCRRTSKDFKDLDEILKKPFWKNISDLDYRSTCLDQMLRMSLAFILKMQNEMLEIEKQ